MAFPVPGSLPNPGIEPASPAPAAGFFITEPSGTSLLTVSFGTTCCNFSGHSPSGLSGPPKCKGLGSAVLVISQETGYELITVNKNHDNSKLFQYGKCHDSKTAKKKNVDKNLLNKCM